MTEKIKYKDLSTPIKIVFVTVWIELTIYLAYFIIGFIQGILGA